MKPHYTGVSGASDGVAASTAYPVRTTNANAGSGLRSIGGTLVPNDVVSFRDVTDGTSNTICVGECSSFLGTNRATQMNSHHGWMMGTVDPGAYAGNHRTFNITTVLHPPNTLTGTGIQNNDGENNGIYSAHEGGVQVLLTDGAVRFVAENIDMETLRRLASRADGKVVNGF